MIKTIQGRVPTLHPTARVAETAVLAGDVTLEAEANVWYGAVLRGDEAPILIGAGSNVQDNAVCHCDKDYPLMLGQNVTVGHGAILHGCTVEDRCIIGMGAILLNGCQIGAGSLVAAGALVTQNTIIPAGSLVMGSPAKVAGPLSQEQQDGLHQSAQEYRHLAKEALPLAAGTVKGALL